LTPKIIRFYESKRDFNNLGENHDNKGWTLATYKEKEEEACTNDKDNYNKNLNSEKGN
jgi:hypothetical protein